MTRERQAYSLTLLHPNFIGKKFTSRWIVVPLKLLNDLGVQPCFLLLEILITNWVWSLEISEFCRIWCSCANQIVTHRGFPLSSSRESLKLPQALEVRNCLYCVLDLMFWLVKHKKQKAKSKEVGSFRFQCWCECCGQELMKLGCIQIKDLCCQAKDSKAV